jgi:hypothetical protein
VARAVIAPAGGRTALLVGALGLLVLVPACGAPSSPSAVSTTSASTTSSVPATPTTPTTSSVTLPEQAPAEIAACTADAKSVEVALDTYMAEKGTYPTPPSPWSAATYAADYAPLTSAADGGPFLAAAPHTSSYVVEYDAAGHVWVAPPGSYGPYNKGQNIDASPNICDAAVG